MFTFQANNDDDDDDDDDDALSMTIVVNINSVQWAMC